MKNKQPIMINQLHLIYPLIIAAISMVSLASFYYGGGSKAGEMVSFASTLSSIILSVIAIIMTIVDVAGQKKSVIDLKDTAEELTKTNIKSQELNNNIMDKLEEITLLRDQLIDQININTEWKEEIKKLLQGNTNDLKPEDYQSIVEEAKKIIEKNNKNKINILGYSDITGSISVSTSNENIKKLKSFLNREYKYGEVENYYILVDKIQDEMGFSLYTVKRAIKVLADQGYLELDKSNDGIIYVNFKAF
ncbi:hypothetical protein [Metabacillus fastidiosus]|uniref:hypothetical protein n=1 Tax=Metabacillus fastidiosus TaxID=1458 RepID=UPI002E22FEA6|nr:hypothetical protein [Metabacillus fastidiosus]